MKFQRQKLEMKNCLFHKEKFSSASTSFWHIVNDSFLVSGILGTCLVLGLNGLWSSSGNVLKSYCHKSTEIQNNNLKAKDRGLELLSCVSTAVWHESQRQQR